jgi:hypothetical protein
MLFILLLAEGVRFELTRLSSTRFRDGCNQPLCEPSIYSFILGAGSTKVDTHAEHQPRYLKSRKEEQTGLWNPIS